MTDAQKYRVSLVRAHMYYITAEINDIDKQIEYLISSNSDYDKSIRLLSSPKSSWICLNFVILNTYVVEQVLLPATMNLLVRRNLSVLHVPVFTSDLY